MLQSLTTFTSSGRQKTYWSLSTEKEQVELWNLEGQVLNQVACESALQILRLRWKDTAFESILWQWEKAA